MRILHTSDWHLGRSFGPASLHADQEAFLDWLVEVVRAERVDVVVVAGDLYDRAIPPTESVALLRETLERLVAHRVRVVAIAGNHDGPDRVAAYDGLTDLAGVVVRGGYGRAGSVTTLELDDGPLDVVAVPYLDPVLTPPGWADDLSDLDGSTGAAPVEAAPVASSAPEPAARAQRTGPATPPPASDDPPSLFDFLVDDPDDDPDDDPGEAAVASTAPTAPGPSRRTHHGVLEQAIRRARASRRAPRGIVVAHTFVSGAVASESERLLTVGGSAEVGVELFAGFDYVALGHLHRPQRVTAGVDTVRYSGTPLPYSFSETQPKQVLLVDIAADGATEVRAVEIPLGRRVATVTGTLDELLADPAHDAVTDHFVRAVLTDRGYVVDARSRLLARFPHVVEVVPRPEPTDATATSLDRAVRGRLDPLEAAVGFWVEVTGEEPEEVERSLLGSVLAHVASAEARA